MKIIAIKDDETYFAEVGRREIAQSRNKYYGDTPRLKVGDTMDLGDGYDFRNQITSACRDAGVAINKFMTVAEGLRSFCIMVGGVEAAQKVEDVLHMDVKKEKDEI